MGTVDPLSRRRKKSRGGNETTKCRRSKVLERGQPCHQVEAKVYEQDKRATQGPPREAGDRDTYRVAGMV